MADLSKNLTFHLSISYGDQIGVTVVSSDLQAAIPSVIAHAEYRLNCPFGKLQREIFEALITDLFNDCVYTDRKIGLALDDDGRLDVWVTENLIKLY